MRQKVKSGTIALFVLLTAALLSKPASALDLIVSHNPDPNDTTQFSSIQAAINFITAQTNTTTTFRVLVQSSSQPYAGPITLINNVPLVGTETARTIINGGGSGAVITANGVANAIVMNFTIENAEVGIDVSNNSSIDIKNNVFQFQSGANGTAAVRIQNSQNARVINNTFYRNNTAIIRDTDNIVTNNIFFGNSPIAISNSASVANITFNDYFNNASDGVTLDPQSIPNDQVSDANPDFVDPANSDFHLLETSPTITSGNPSFQNKPFSETTSEMGAYGGPDADTIPFMVSGVTVSLSGTDSAIVSWNTNSSYVITNSNPAKQGGYNVHYNLNESGPPYDNVVTALSTSTSVVVTGLTAAPTQPAAPIVNEPDFADGILIISWSSVPRATSYILHYRDTDVISAPTNTVDVNSTSHTLTGLINGHNYEITVTALAQSAYHFSVTAFDFTVKAAGGGDPGVSHESNYSPEAILLIGEIQESDPSDPVLGMPDIIIANPNLPNKGCFIATAAYGYYSSPEVQVLRDFRDRYLVTNRPGKAFVKWYYRYGPVGAAFITTHPWLKPVVRVALMPLITLAFAMLHTSLSAKIGVMLFIALMSCLVIHRKKLPTGRELR